MRNHFIWRAAFCVVFLLSFTISGTKAQGKLQTESLKHEGIDRTYHVFLPSGFDPKKQHPLVLALHGGGGQGKVFDRSTNYSITAAADKRECVLVFPDGIDKRWNDGRDGPFRKAFGRKARKHDDLGFLSKLIDTMHKKYHTDPKRVYSTGISNGGFMSVRLAMDLSDKIAAIAPVAAQISKELENKKPKNPISVMITNGTKDPLVPFDGGHIRIFGGRSRGEILSTEVSINYFCKYNGCKRKPIIKKLPDNDKDDGSRVKMEIYQGGKNGTEVILMRVIGGGHTWPGGKQYLNPRLIGNVCRDFNASEMILDFFLRHKRD